MKQQYFLTVSWCKRERGIFCDKAGGGFSKDEPHTQAEMLHILGPFWIILSPQSECFTAEQMTEYVAFRPLEEYSGQYGIALMVEQIPIRSSFEGGTR